MMNSPGRPPDRDRGKGREGEAELVARARAGDPGAFRILVEAHRDRVYGLALRILRSPDDAEEVAQDAFVRAWHALPRFRGEASFGTWLHRIVTRLAFDRSRVLRNRAMREEPDPTGEWPAPTGLPEGSDAGRHRRLERMVAGLSEIQRAAVTLYYYEDHSVERVAEILGLNANTVKTHLRRARGVLREAWRGSRSEGES